MASTTSHSTPTHAILNTINTSKNVQPYSPLFTHIKDTQNQQTICKTAKPVYYTKYHTSQTISQTEYHRGSTTHSRFSSLYHYYIPTAHNKQSQTENTTLISSFIPVTPLPNYLRQVPQQQTKSSFPSYQQQHQKQILLNN